MRSQALFVALARNNLWSNHRLHAACDRLDEAAYRAERPAFFGSIHATLDHILIVDLVYLGRLAGVERVAPDCEELCADRGALAARQREVDRELLELCEGHDADSLAERVTFTRSTGDVYHDPVASVLLHLFLHQVHHRGQVHEMLSQTSVAPPQLDEFFLSGDLRLRSGELAELDLPVA